MPLHQSPDAALLSVDLAETLPELDRRLKRLSRLLGELEGHAAWAPPDETGPAVRRRLANIYAQIQYLDEQPASGAVLAPGLLAAPAELIAEAEAINALKAKVEALFLRMRELKGIDRKGRVRPLVDVALTRMGYARLHKQQTTRQIVCLAAAPVRVGFSRAGSSKFHRITVAEALEAAERLDEPARSFCIAQLHTLPPTAALARITSRYPYTRANVVLRDADGATVRFQRIAAMPLLYPAGAGDPLPKVTWSDATTKHRRQRSDRQVEPEPFLPPLKLHRYRTSRAPGPSPALKGERVRADG